jgi:hypothetical protein
VSTNLWSKIKVGLSGVILVLVLFSLRPVGSPLMARANKSAHLLWETDLSKFGYQGRPPVLLGQADPWGFWAYQQGVVFTEPNVVAVFFIVHDDTAGNTVEQRKPLPSDPYRLVTIFLNAERGELIKKLDWPLPIGTQFVSHSFFFPGTRGRFVVGIGDTLSLYSPEFELLARHPTQAELEAIASPAGDTILLQDARMINGQWTSRYDLLDTDDLSVRKSWEGLPNMNQIVSGDELAWNSRGGLFFKAPDAEPKELTENTESICGYWSFINKETVAALDCRSRSGEKLLLFSRDGKIIQVPNMGSEQMDGPAVGSRNGRRFAFATYKWALFGQDRNPKKLTARVYEIGVEKPLLTLDVSHHYDTSANFQTPYGDTRFGWGGLALSPDGGELLAVKSGPMVQMYQLPEPGRSIQCSANCENESDAVNAPPVEAHPAPALPTPTSTPSVPSQTAEQALSWLPSDTETVTVANGPFVMPDLKPQADETHGGGESDDYEVERTFKSIALGLFGFKDGLLAKHFTGAKILLGMEGSRHFRPPSGLGGAPYEGCAIAVFEDDITNRASAFVKDSSTVALRTEQIEGQQVTVFQEKLEEDVWTTFVAFPKPNIALAASSKEYLHEVLARLKGKRGERALPDTLTEWKHVNAQAEFWAVRHYDKRAGAMDPTSPFGGKKTANVPDDQAIGLTFSFDPSKSKTATVTYLSADEHILQNVQKNLFPIETEPAAKELNVRHRLAEPGVVVGSYDLGSAEAADLFAFVLEALLGHAIYV